MKPVEIVRLFATVALAIAVVCQSLIITSYRTRVSTLMASSQRLIQANDRLEAADKKLKEADKELEENDARLKYAAERVRAFCAEKGVKLR